MSTDAAASDWCCRTGTGAAAISRSLAARRSWSASREFPLSSRRSGSQFFGKRQIERKGTALADFAGQTDLSAEQAGELAAYRQPEPGAAVMPAGRAVGLLERLKNDVLLILRYPDASGDDREPDNRGCRAQASVLGRPARARRGHAK